MTTNGQYVLNGLAIGHATDYLVQQVDGVYDLPDELVGQSTTLDQPRLDHDGDFPVDLYVGPRVMTFKIVCLTDLIMAANPTWDKWTAANYNLAQLSRAWCYSRTEALASDLTFGKPWSPETNFRIRKARVVKRAFPSTADLAQGEASGAIMLRASNPGIFHDSPGGTHSVTVASGSFVTITNGNSAPIYPILIYNGTGGSTGSTPHIQASDGSFLDLSTNFISPSPLTMNTWDQSVFDAVGTRRDLWLSLASSWTGFVVQPGQASTFTVSGTGSWTVNFVEEEYAL
jgi:hypothetical protein